MPPTPGKPIETRGDVRFNITLAMDPHLNNSSLQTPGPRYGLADTNTRRSGVFGQQGVRSAVSCSARWGFNLVCSPHVDTSESEARMDLSFHPKWRFLQNDCGLLPNINHVESAAVAEDCPLNFIPSAERFLRVNQLRLLKVIPVFIRG
jgi:hypothetical protein